MASRSKQTYLRENGELVEMQVPVLVSASRSTDIPAFYADWFFHRLKVGYSAWTNPFNGSQMYVSYQNTRFIVFWSKNPYPLIKHLPQLKEKNIGCYIQFTLNDYEDENLETGVPPLNHRIETFKSLSRLLGKEAVIWRFDPMILTDNITIDDLLKKVGNIGDRLQGFTEKLVFSYADIVAYRKVKSNLEKSGIKYTEWREEQMEEFACRLSEMNIRKGWGYRLATCGEKIDISKYGIEHNRCIDSDLIVRLAWHDKELMKSMGVRIETVPPVDLFGGSLLPDNAILLPDNHYFVSVHKKDPGQRQFCGCMAAKDIGEYNTCPHLCEYCYANASKQAAMKNYKTHKLMPYAETITGR